jgi:hypothetical protein
VNVVPTGAKVVKRLSTTQVTRAVSSINLSACTAKFPFLSNKESVVNASKNCQRNVRKNLDVGMIATVLQMLRSACLVLRVKM